MSHIKISFLIFRFNLLFHSKLSISMSTSSITPFLIGVAGGPCSGKYFCNKFKLNINIHLGKSTVCQKIVEALQPKDSVDQTNRVTVIAMENFYKPKTLSQRDMASRGNYNLDHPTAFDEKLLFKTLEDLLNGKTVKVK